MLYQKLGNGLKTIAKYNRYFINQFYLSKIKLELNFSKKLEYDLPNM